MRIRDCTFLVVTLAAGLAVAAFGPAQARPSAQTAITTPKAQLGFNFGDDYQLANYKQIAEYWRKLDGESDRLTVQEIGRTAEGRPHLMAIVTSPANHKNLAKYKDISKRLALADGVTEQQARALAKEGKAVVWIDGGLHATETLGAQQLGEMVYQMVSRTDEETMRFLDETIILFVHANPDGNDLVADWYMRQADPKLRSTAGLPRLYQKYIGHDNNRDFFASTQAETENINRILYHEWLPQILYNHHQSGPAGTVVWSSPQRDPYNYNLDPLLVLGLQALGTHMHQRLASEGKPGATMASGGAYDGWWNGGIRNTGNFHNIIAILTETIGNPTPMRIRLVMQRQLPNRDHPYPIAPQEWRFKQSVDYSISFNRAVIDYAARNREHLLYNIYKMGQRSIERGSQDTWTPSPTRYAAIAEKMDGGGGGGGRGGGGGAAEDEREARMWAEMRKAGVSRPAWLHSAGRSAGLPDGDQVRQRVARGERDRSARHARVHGRDAEVSGGIVCCADGTGLPAARDRYVRAAGPSQRHSLPWGAADAALRQRRLDAGAADGRAVRPDPRAVQRPVRTSHGLERQAGSRPGRERGHCWLPAVARGQRFGDRRKPPARGGRRRVHGRGEFRRGCEGFRACAADCQAARRGLRRRAGGVHQRRPGSSRRESACGINTADRWNRAGRAGSSSSSSSSSIAYSRRNSMPADSAQSTTC